MKTIEIEVALLKYFDFRRNIIVPNISWGLNIHECDLLVVSKNGYCTEIEIKISKSDLIADKNKRHKHKSHKIKYLYFAIPSTLESKININQDIPERAGLISILPNKRIKIIKTPIKNKYCEKLSDKEILKVACLGTMRIFGLKKKIIKYFKKYWTNIYFCSIL